VLRPAWTTILLFVLPRTAEMTHMYQHTQPVVEIGSHELFAQTVSNLDPPQLCLPSNSDYRCEPLCPTDCHFHSGSVLRVFELYPLKLINTVNES
jgi:hypothetical protein